MMAGPKSPRILSVSLEPGFKRFYYQATKYDPNTDGGNTVSTSK